MARRRLPAELEPIGSGTRARRPRVSLRRRMFPGPDAAARGLALFFGLFSLANALTLLRGRPGTEDIWWIDLSFLGGAIAPAVALVAAVLLLWWGAVPRAPARRRLTTGVAAAGLALAAGVNSAAFYEAIGSGAVDSPLPVPSSLLVAVAFVWLAFVVAGKSRRGHGSPVAVGLVVAVLIAVFPVVQMLSFGITDYRRPADAAVIFGARAYANGVLSTSLSDRVRTGVGLYKAGLVRKLVMSGAVGASGTDESEAMKRWAVEWGVPDSAILLDHNGVNTDASVRNTGEIFDRNRMKRVLAVSQFYHLPRVKLAYRAAGREVLTVPAEMSIYISGTPGSMLREVPAFWTYWARGLARQLR